MANRTLILLGIMLSLSFQVSVQAQTYASPELQKRIEAEQAAKLKKIQADPAAYRLKGGDPTPFFKEQSAKDQALTVYEAPVNLKRTDLYKLVSMDALDLNNKHSSQEMKAFQAEAQSEFEKTNIVLDWETHSWYFLPRDRQIKPAEKKFWVDGDRLQFKDCRECQDNTFTIAKHTENALVLHLQPQDEGQYFVFSLTFKR